MAVYDTVNHVHWLADANLDAKERFGLSICDASNTTPCVNTSGPMSYRAAMIWVAVMNAAHYLGHTDWQLPTTPIDDHSCSSRGPNGANFGYNCVNSAMGALYSKVLGLKKPDTAVPISGTTVGPFNNFQPYLYWSCVGAPDSQGPCTSDAPAKGFEYSFSFGNGFEGTDPGGLHIAVGNQLYVTAYYPG